MSKIRTRRWQGSVAIVVALLMVGSVLLTGCGQSTATNTSAATQTAAQRGYILIGYPVPVTGNYAVMGESAQWVADQALQAINKDGGIFIKSLNKKLPVKYDMKDTQSSPTIAAQVATEMITKDNVDLLVAAQTPDIVNPVSAIGERYKVPVLGFNAPIEPWMSGGPYHWSFDVAMPIADTVGEIDQEFIDLSPKTGKVVGLLFPNDPDGVGASHMMDNDKTLTGAGIKIVDPGRFPDDTNDFTSLINTFKQNKVEMITGTLPTNTFATFWRQAKQQGYYPAFVDVGKAVDYPSGVTALGGTLANYVSASITWSPDWPFKSSLTGQTAQQLGDAYTQATSKPPTAALGFYEAGWEVVNDVLTRAQDLDPNTIRDAIIATNLNTVLAPVKFNAEQWSRTPVLQAQWVYQGAGGGSFPWKWVAFYADPNFPQIPATAKLVVPIPH
ncbi:MAG TPA: ABC transporter substrate-binding protein [Spirochaetia bacterium]|nr:ABC transporter substrate-binding protein [Spirochaetia bacterium]